MHYVAICLDKADSLQVRLAHRAAHLDFLRANAATIKVCGPLLADDGTTMTGSLLIVDATDRKAVDAILAQDHYRKTGLFESVDVRPWRWVVGEPVA